MDRARIISHMGSEIVFLDFSNCPLEEAQGVITAATPLIRSKPEKTVLTLTYTDGGKFDSEIISALKQFTNGNEPYVKAAAVVGITGLQKIVLDAVSFFPRENSPLLTTWMMRRITKSLDTATSCQL